MRERPVDPRDTRWESDTPAYRVHFWRHGHTSEWELTGADIDAVLHWATQHADGRQYAVYACIESPDGLGLGLIRLLGTDHP